MPDLELIPHVAEELLISVDGECPLDLHQSGVKHTCKVDNLGRAHGLFVRLSVDPGWENRGGGTQSAVVKDGGEVDSLIGGPVAAEL